MKQFNFKSHVIKITVAVFAFLSIVSSVSATTVTFSNNTNTPIPDDGYNGTLGSMAGTSVSVTGIPAGAIIQDIKVVSSIDHTWVGDLVLKLQSPDGTVLGIMSRPGYSESIDDGTGGFGLGDNLVSGFPITFSDTGTYDAEVLGGLGDANNICQDDGQCSFFPNPGAVTTPPSTFSDLYAGTMNGTWTLYVGDSESGDNGALVSWTLEITYTTAPLNDDCAGAITIGCSLSSRVAGTTVGSSVDAGYSDCGAGGDNSTEQGVWYVYPGDNSLVTITTCDTSGDGYDTRLTVYSGTCGALTCVTANDDMTPDCTTGDYRSSVTFNAYTGTDYYVFVHGYQTGTDLSETGDFFLNLSCGSLCSPVPANDECSAAEALTLGVTANGNTTCANSSPTLPNPFCASAFATPLDNWYTLTTGVGSTYNISLTEVTAANLGFTLYTGTCGSLTEVSAFCSPAGTFPVSLDPLSTYYIRVFNTSTSDEGTYTLAVNAFTPVANDECSSVTPTVLVNGAAAVTLTGTTVNASASADEMNYLGFATVWEAVTLTGLCNNLTVDFCGTAPGIMAQGYVTYTDCPITGITAGTADFTTCVDGNLTVDYYSLPAGTYYLPVISDPVFNTLGSYTMNVSSVTCAGPPLNDSCQNAVAIACGTSTSGTTINATIDEPLVTCTGGSVAADVWYTYVGTGQDFTASLCNPNTTYDTKLDIYTGTCGALVSVACDDDSCGLQSQVGISASILGTTYYIRVHGFDGEVGNFELAILDNDPTITCPGTVSANTDTGLCTASGVNLGTPVTGDDCGIDTVTNDAPQTFPVGNTTVTWTVTDLAGHSATCTQTVTVTDNENPVITCPADITVNAATGTCVSNALSIGTATATDNCGVASVVSDASTTVFAVGVTVVTWTATDVNGNTSTCTQSITVVDNQLPTINCPIDVSVSTDSASCEAAGVSLGTPVTADNCAVDTVFKDAPASYLVGNTTVTWTVIDVNGNTATCSQTVTVSDNELPMITCPGDVTVNSDAGLCSASGVVLGSATTSDNCSIANTSNDASATFSVGSTTVTWTTTDASGNSASCTQTITVIDNELPVITCGADVTVNNEVGLCGITNTSLSLPSATDNCGIQGIGNDGADTLAVGVTVLTWTTTDVNGNTATCLQSVTVVDNELPVITCAVDVSVSTDSGSCDATGVVLGLTVVADNCGIDTLTNDAPLTFPTGTTTVTWTVTDINGNIATCTQTVTVTEDELPVIICPADVTVTADSGACNATGVVLGTPVASDNCAGLVVTNDAPSSYALGTTIVTWTATDAAGNVSTCTQTVTVTDIELPAIFCVAVTVNNDAGVCGILGSSLVAPVATDNCGIASVTSDAASTISIGSTTIVWTVADVNGNINTCSQLVTVIDSEAPTISCPTAVSVSTDSGSCDATNVVLGLPVTSDNCGIDTVINDAPSSFPTGSTTVTWTVTDVNGNTASCTQTVFVTENELPVITCPADVTVAADAGSCSASVVVLGTPVATDNCPGVTTSNDAPSSFALGITTVTWTATDAAGNTAACTQTVTVIDTEVPVITCNAVTVNSVTGLCGLPEDSLSIPVATDNCSISSITNDAPALLPVGTTTVNWTATDGAGNTASCSQTVTVIDTELPIVTCPTDVTVNTDGGICSATNVILGVPSTSDNCAVDVVGNDSPISYPIGNTIVTWTVTDVNGNSATCAQTVTVIDAELPVVSCPGDVTVSADSGLCSVSGVVLGTASAFDNCAIANVTNDAPSAFSVGNTIVTWTAVDSAGNVSTCGQTVTVTDDEVPVITCSSVTVNNTPGICGALGISLTPPVSTDNCGVDNIIFAAADTLTLGSNAVIWTATDVAGNSASCTQTVVVVDNEAPAITCPADITVSADTGSCNATNVTIGLATATDNCAVDSISNDAPPIYPIGATTVTWAAVDVNGNTNTCTQTVTVIDAELPVITCPADITATADSGQCSASTVVLGTATATDNCPGTTVSNDAPSSFAVGTTTVTWTATDAAGNVSTCTQTVVVTDIELPVVSCNASVTVNNDPGLCGALSSSLTAPIATDNCNIAGVVSDAPDTLAIGTTVVTWTATDSSGNTASCTQTVTVVDNEQPAITCPADITINADSGICTSSVALGNAVTTDNCGVLSVSNDGTGSYPVGNTTVTWTVTDINGNSASCSQLVTVVDVELPVIVCPADVSVSADSGSCDAANVTIGTATATDNCTSVTITNDAPTTFLMGVTTVTWTATDAAGNAAVCTQLVTVTDAELPVLTCPADITVNADSASCIAASVTLGSPVATDNCAGVTVTNDAPASFAIGATTVTWTATDSAGNVATCAQIVTVVDNELPVITCPAAVTANTDAGLCTASGVVLGNPTATDNCTGVTVANDAPASFPVGATTVTWTATDAAGNTATCTQTVTVTDNQNPTITCPGAVTTNVNASPCVANNVTLGSPTTADNCSIATTTNNAPATFPAGVTTVTWTTTDANGNTATCSQTVTVNANVDTSVVKGTTGFTANATGATYQWYNCTTQSIIAGQTSATFAPTASGSYAVIITQNGCVDTSRCFTFVYISIGESLEANNFRVYPNPATDQLNIEVEGTINGLAQVQLFDIEGKLLRQLTLENMTGVHSISLLDLPGSIYFLRISTDRGIANTKVMKVH